MADIKDLLNDIIHDTNTSYDSNPVAQDEHKNHVQFDKVGFREKLSLYVLKDLVCAMMHDDTKDLDGMIDQSIMKHIRTNYGGSCYDYLKSSCKNLQSPLIGDIIMEINDHCDRVEQEVCLTKNPNYIEEAALKTKELLKNCDNYEEFRQDLMDKVSKDIVEDVTNVVVNGNEAPVFDNLDESLNKQSKEDVKKKSSDLPETEDLGDTSEDVTNESLILRMCGEIVTECALQQHRKMSVEEGLNQAIVEYCIVQMDGLFKQHPRYQDAFDRYLK